ncbi:MAG: cytochrome c biogenesis protein CcdA [Alphaproteobacteria bacterium]|nr:cytochrome c biogenesis protein CcdA [Alphaproteobacteria bacterium]
MNTLNILKAFAEGLMLIVTPCVLPILPLVLAASLDGGRRRPYGVAFGFAFMLIGLAMVSRQLFGALHVENQTVKLIALIFLLGFGLHLLFPTLSEWVQAKKEGEDLHTEKLSDRWDEDSGFLSGLGIGLLIALAWTPCAGPTMAQAIEELKSRTNPEATSVIVLFAVGAGLPMLVVSLLLRRMIRAFPSLNEHGLIIRAILGLIILIMIVAIFFGVDKQLLPPATRGIGLQPQKPASQEIEPISELHLFLPQKQKGPQTKKPLQPPSPPAVEKPLTMLPLPKATSSLNFGLGTENYVGATERRSNKVVFYDPAKKIRVGFWTLNGRWHIKNDKIVSAFPGATLRLRIKARRASVIMAMPEKKQGKASIFINRKPIAKLGGRDVKESNAHISAQAEYELMNQPQATEVELDIVACVKGLEIYVATFEE